MKIIIPFMTVNGHNCRNLGFSRLEFSPLTFHDLAIVEDSTLQARTLVVSWVCIRTDKSRRCLRQPMLTLGLLKIE